MLGGTTLATAWKLPDIVRQCGGRHKTQYFEMVCKLLADHVGLELHGRLYQPRAEILDGNWKFPEAQPVN